VTVVSTAMATVASNPVTPRVLLSGAVTVMPVTVVTVLVTVATVMVTVTSTPSPPRFVKRGR